MGKPARLKPGEICWIEHRGDNGVTRQCSGCRDFHSTGWLGCTLDHKRGLFYCDICRMFVDAREMPFNGKG